MKHRVLLGMSGGVDSSLAAILVQENGYEVNGITFLFIGQEHSNNLTFSGAEELAGSLNIRLIKADLRKEFKESVIRYFIE
jgi:tRNA-specific 2-thiouridylase